MTTSALNGAQMVELCEGVHAYLQLPGGWCVSNAGVIAGGDGALVIDTLATESRARKLREVVDGLAPGPVRTIVNTHHHGDHNFGNHIFGPSAAIVAHDLARTEMQETGMALTALWPQVKWGEIRVSLPTLTFTDRVTAYVGDRRVELIHVGPAHTTNDVVVWLPDEGVLFAGDVLLSGATPFALFGSIAGSLEAIAQLRALAPRVVVCGHGPIAGPEILDRNREYFEWIGQLALDGLARELTPLQLAREADAAQFADLLDGERIVGNLHRAYDELHGSARAYPLAVLPIFEEMIEFNNGELPTCLA